MQQRRVARKLCTISASGPAYKGILIMHLSISSYGRDLQPGLISNVSLVFSLKRVSCGISGAQMKGRVSGMG